ncbi:phosphotransferase [Microbulbifer hainanensis]|uniref:phosphotransferase n=1 Tax=Microbulbifer hainanensis TaxID=2735675 RepID=UPI00186685C6|nr:choline kinase family protein [Microbulbifer hainanensis]
MAHCRLKAGDNPLLSLWSRDINDMNAPESEIIPPDWQRWSRVRPSLLRPLTGGLTNRSFLIEANGERLVLRRNSPISDALDLNRSAEAAALRCADSAGICAPVIYCDPNHQYLVTRFIEGRQWGDPEAASLKQLAQLLRRIHALPAIDVRLDIEEKIANYWRSINRRADFCQKLWELDQNVRRHIAVAHSLSDSDCLCHNDLVMTNLIVANRENLYAIDWEYAAMGDPFYELAVITKEHGLNRQQQRMLIAEYLNRPVGKLDEMRLDHWRLIYGYLSALWYAVQWCTGSMKDASIYDCITSRVTHLFAQSAAMSQ